MDGSVSDPYDPVKPRTDSERRVLSAVQAAGGLASAEIARRTAMSAQSASVITRSLEAEGLLTRGVPVKGKVGKPQTPMLLDPEGAFSFGLRIGRRKSDLVLADFCGTVRGQRTVNHTYPTPDATLGFLRSGIEALRGTLSPVQQARLCGIGVAAPFELWNWLDIVGAPRAEMNAWRDFSFRRSLAPDVALPVETANDATMACAAEQLFGLGRALDNFAYFYIGTFIGGGLVLEGRIWPGSNGNAGAFGSIPCGDVGAPRHQLIHNASLFDLEDRLRAAGEPSDGLREGMLSGPVYETVLAEWIADTARSIASAALAVTAVVDTDTIVIDSALAAPVTSAIVEAVAGAVMDIDRQGIRTPAIRSGTIGQSAGAIGAAYLPITQRYLTSGQHLARSRS